MDMPIARRTAFPGPGDGVCREPMQARRGRETGTACKGTIFSGTPNSPKASREIFCFGCLYTSSDFQAGTVNYSGISFRQPQGRQTLSLRFRFQINGKVFVCLGHAGVSKLVSDGAEVDA
jgi:hypothetical protein